MFLFYKEVDKDHSKLVLKGKYINPDGCKNLVKPSISDIFNCVRPVNPDKAFKNIWKGTKVSVLCTLDFSQKLKVDDDGPFNVRATNIFFGNILSNFFNKYMDMTYFKIDREIYNAVNKNGNTQKYFIINGVLEELDSKNWNHHIRVSKENQGFIREIDNNTFNNYLLCLERLYDVKHSGNSGLIESVNKLREKQHLQRYNYNQDMERERERRRKEEEEVAKRRREHEAAEAERRRKEEEEWRRKQEEDERRQKEMEEERKRKEEFDKMERERIAKEMFEMENKKTYVNNACNNILAAINSDSSGKKNMLIRRILDYCRKVEDEKNFQVVLEMSDDFINELKMERRDVLREPFSDEALENCFSPYVYIIKPEVEERPANNIMNNGGRIEKVDNTKEKKKTQINITNVFDIPVPLTILEQNLWKVSLILCKSKLMRDEMAFEYADFIFSGDEWKSAESVSNELIDQNGVIENYRQNIIESIQNLLRFIVNEDNRVVTLCSNFVNGYFERICKYLDYFNNYNNINNSNAAFDDEFKEGVSRVWLELNDITYGITPMDVYITLYRMLIREQSMLPP